MSRKAFVVAGIVECLQLDRGWWELIDSHGIGTVVCPFTTGRGMIVCTSVYIYIYIYITVYLDP